MSDVRQIASFFAQDLFFGVDVMQVREIIREVAITRVPLAPPMVSGLINMRGQIVTAIDLRRCLGLPERPSGQLPAGLILQAEEGLVGLIVDEVGTVFEMPVDAFESPPEILKGRLGALVSRICTLPDRLLLVMDTEHFLTEALALDMGTPPDPVHRRGVQDSCASSIQSSAIANENGSPQISTESGGAQ
jgi:purine-binding chemotaxis protein CheW